MPGTPLPPYSPFAAVDRYSTQMANFLASRSQWQTNEINSKDDPVAQGKAKKMLAMIQRALGAMEVYIKQDYEAIDKYDLGILAAIGNIGRSLRG